MVAFQSEIAPNPNKMICLIPKKASLKQFKWTITKIVLSEFYWPVHVGETALFCLTEAPINEASFLGTARLEFKKCFPAKTTWVTLLQKHMGGGTKHLQRKQYFQCTLLDLNSSEFKSILYKINSKSLHWYLEILLFSHCWKCLLSFQLSVWSHCSVVNCLQNKVCTISPGISREDEGTRSSWSPMVGCPRKLFFILQLSQDLQR